MASVAFAFDGKTTAARQRAEDLAARYVTNVSEETRLAIRQLVVRSLAEGIAPRQLARLIREVVGLNAQQAAAVANYRHGLEDLGLSAAKVEERTARYAARKLRERSELIARTEIMTALNAGIRESWNQARERGLLSNPVKTWLITPDERLCPICAPLADVEVPVDETFPGGYDTPPAHPRCLPGDALVLPCGRVTASSERWYDGDFIVIRTSAGNELSCTPNHPVLTDRGWAPAASLHEGRYVVSRIVDDVAAARVRLDHQDVPSPIEEVARLLQDLPESRAAAVPVSAEDFHGDGAGSEIAVVRANGLLRNDVDAALDEEMAQSILGGVEPASALDSECLSAEERSRLRNAPGSVVRRARLMKALCSGHTTPLEGFGLAAVAWLNSARPKVTVQGGSRAADGPEEPAGVCDLGDLEPGLAGKVALDEVIGVERRRFSGHVFNLQTATEVYIANNIITHNCRCTVSVTEPLPGLP